MQEFLAFRKMITPLIIQIIFWIGVVVEVVGGLVTMVIGMSARAGGGGLVFIGLLMILLGPLAVRIYCELLIVLFRIYDDLQAIRKAVTSSSPIGGFPVVPIADPHQKA